MTVTRLWPGRGAGVEASFAGGGCDGCERSGHGGSTFYLGKGAELSEAAADGGADPVTSRRFTFDADEDVRVKVVPDRLSGPGSPGTPIVVYQHRDHLSSIAVVSDATGGVDEGTAYMAYGRPIKPLVNARQYLGERYDAEIGLAYLNARYYDARWGLFVSPDTLDPTKAGVMDDSINRRPSSF